VDLRDPELAEDLAIALTGLEAHRRRRRDHDDPGLRPAGERGEPVQDHAVADLVLRAADDDDRSFAQGSPHLLVGGG
jgi:hypothetical protein